MISVTLVKKVSFKMNIVISF